MIQRLPMFALAAVLAFAAAAAPASTPPPKTCKTNASCGKGEFCEVPAPHKGGVCTRKPEVCTADYKPVCGTNHKVYGNACEAHRAGVNVEHDGICGRPVP